MTAFELDPFQEEAIAAVDAGESVVVTAPTGSGKTLIAEEAMRAVLGRGKRAFYTTPLKALSNQKYNDFGRLFPEVGLLTGDNTINGEAPIVVMTTEVLRNMIYAGSGALDELDLVVLDEVHYLQDPARGPVWEEIIVHAPDGVQMVCLSATVSNADEFAAWVRDRRGRTRLVRENHRPVPLTNLYALKDRWHDEVHLERMFTKKGVNWDLESRIAKARRFGTPRRSETIAALDAADMLPVIYFIFSRAGCDDAARKLVEAGAGFTTREERTEIERVAEQRTSHLDDRDLGVLGYDSWLYGLEAGVAPHHAGLVPAFKETVEELFARGLVKVVFATETLSLGINMPARTVVLESLSKFNGETHELLRPGDYTQLTGRAGRRGIDPVGYGVVLHSRYVPFKAVTKLASAGSHALTSSFRPSYNMAVNLIANHPRDRAETLLNASFGQFQVGETLAKEERTLVRQEADLKGLRAEATCELGEVADYVETTQQSGGYDVGDVIEPPALSGRFVVVKRQHGRRVELVVVSERGRTSTIGPKVYKGSARVGSIDIDDPRQVLRDPSHRRWIGRRIGELDSRHPVAACPDRAAHVEAYRRAIKLERRIARTRTDIERLRGGLVRDLDRILHMLEERGYVDGWALTDQGEQLRSIYSDTDLLLAEVIRTGLLDGLEPAEVASLVSMTVYEARRQESAMDGWPTPALAGRGTSLVALHESLAEREKALGIRQTRRPERGFMLMAYQWARGMDLDEISGLLDPGDFVRITRQLLDVLRQIRDAVPWLSEVTATAIRSIDRGVVAAPRFEHG